MTRGEEKKREQECAQSTPQPFDARVNTANDGKAHVAVDLLFVLQNLELARRQNVEPLFSRGGHGRQVAVDYGV